MNFLTVQSFTFKNAVYYASDGFGDTVALRIYYARNKYRIQSLGTVVNNSFRQELSNFAKDLLERKHGVNFATKSSE